MNRSEEEQFYRECVNGFKLLASASLYDTESTNGNGGSLPQNMETDDDLSSDYPVAVPASTNHARSPEILHRTASFQPEVESNLHSDTSFEDPIEVQDIKPSRIPQRSGRIRPAPTYSRTPPRKEKEVCGSFFVRRQNEKEATSKAAIVAVSHKGNGEVYQVGGPFLSTTHQLATSSGTPLRSSFPVFGSTSPTSPGSQIQLQKGILQSYQSQSSSLNPRPFDLHNLSNGLPANRSPSPPPPKVIRSLERAKKDIVTID